MEEGLKSMTKAPRILVLTLSLVPVTCSGANRRARIKRQSPDAEVQTVDALADCRFLFRVFYVCLTGSWCRYAPALWDRFSLAAQQQMRENRA